MDETDLAAYMAYVGLRIDDVEQFFTIVAGGLDKKIDFDTFAYGCMTMKGPATSLDLHKEYWLLQNMNRQFEVFQHDCKNMLAQNVALSSQVYQKVDNGLKVRADEVAIKIPSNTGTQSAGSSSTPQWTAKKAF